MRLRSFAAILLSIGIGLATWLVAPDALALTQVKLFDISYHECPPEIAAGSVTSGNSQSANCFIVTGKTENTSNKMVVNADVFGRIYDANNNSVMENRTRVGAIDEIPPGIGEFEFRITVPASQPTPLKLEQFKAAGFTGKVRR